MGLDPSGGGCKELVPIVETPVSCPVSLRAEPRWEPASPASLLQRCCCEHPTSLTSNLDPSVGCLAGVKVADYEQKGDGETLLVKISEQGVCPGVPLSLLPGIFDNCLLFSFIRPSWENCSRAGVLSTAQAMQNPEYSEKLLFNSRDAQTTFFSQILHPSADH